MTVVNKITEDEKEAIVDDISDEKLNETKLAELKAKLAAKQKEKEVAKIVAKKARSLNIGVIGSGQSGSRLASSMFKLGYDAVAVNTAVQDLKNIELPEANKLLLEGTIGGAAKELEVGKAVAEANIDKIAELINLKLADAQVHMLCLSLGGGSGAGSCEPLVELLSSTGKPLVVMTVLPMDSEDAQTKSNALETLSKLAKFTQSKKVNNLIVVDNAKIEAIYSDVGQFDFFKVANQAIVEPIDVFNTLSALESGVKSLDSAEFAKLLVDGEGLSVYGEIEVKDYEGETALAEAVINNLSSNLLASGFDLKQSSYAGVIFAASPSVWAKIPQVYTNYAMSMIDEQCGTPKATFKGIYQIDSDEDCVKIYSFFTGLGLPSSRIDQLKSETKLRSEAIKNKDVQRNLTLNLDTGTNDVVSEAQKIKAKIAAKKSAFGKIISPTLDKRNK